MAWYRSLILLIGAIALTAGAAIERAHLGNVATILRWAHCSQPENSQGVYLAVGGHPLAKSANCCRYRCHGRASTA